MYWLTTAGEYYEGDRQFPSDREVTKRPSPRHVWVGDKWENGPLVAIKFVPLDFLNLFTEAEQIGVVAATLNSAAVKLWYDRMLAASYITVEDPRVSVGLQALVDAGLLSSERMIQVIAEMSH